MYHLSEEQVNYIRADIKRRGIEIESLQEDLLDHICCIMEERMQENANFETVYSSVIKTFYKTELKEIETETIILLTNKNYYTMKKSMIVSGIFSAVVLSLGILLKFLHAPGAAACIVTGIFIFSFIFLPLMSALRIKEKEKMRDRLIISLGVVPAILMSVSFVFRIQHWPGAMILFYLAIGILVLLFLPLYLVNGLRKTETRVNTIVTSVLLVAGCGLWLTIVASPAGVKMQNSKNTTVFLRNEQILKTEYRQVEPYVKSMSVNETSFELGKKIYSQCEDLKSLIVEHETGFKTIDENFEAKNISIDDKWLKSYVAARPEVSEKLTGLRNTVEQYNEANAALSKSHIQTIPVQSTVLDMSEERIVGALNSLIQIQMYVLQNERELVAMK
jgi:hypothetical protein